MRKVGIPWCSIHSRSRKNIMKAVTSDPYQSAETHHRPVESSIAFVIR